MDSSSNLCSSAHPAVIRRERAHDDAAAALTFDAANAKARARHTEAKRYADAEAFEKRALAQIEVITYC